MGEYDVGVNEEWFERALSKAMGTLRLRVARSRVMA
jgi:hypothetical protein